MAQETSDFDGWLKRIELTTSDLELVPALDAISHLALDAFGLQIWFVKILGRRWSYIAGEKINKPPQSGIHRIPLQGDIGAVSDTWETLTETERDKLTASLNRIISTTEAFHAGAQENKSSALQGEKS